MKYFLHDSNSFNDEKITELFMSFGYEGLGLFYTLLEKLASQEKPIKTSVLKSQLKVGKKLEKCWKFMESIELIHSNNDETFNIKLMNFSEKYQIKKEKNSKRVSEFRERQEVIKNVTHYERICNAPKVKESKVNINNKDIKRFTPPSIDEVSIYISENKFNVDAQSFIDHYTTNGWKQGGKTQIKDWKAAVRTWNNRSKTTKSEYRHPATEIFNNDIDEQVKRFNR